MNFEVIHQSINALRQRDDLDTNQAVKDSLDSIFAEEDAKLDGMAYWIEDNEKDISWLDQKIKRLTAKKRSLEKQQNYLTDLLTHELDWLGVKSKKLQGHRLKVRNFRAKTVIDREDLVPEEYKTKSEVIKVDRQQIYADLKEGKQVPGAHLEDNRHAIIDE